MRTRGIDSQQRLACARPLLKVALETAGGWLDAPVRFGRNEPVQRFYQAVLDNFLPRTLDAVIGSLGLGGSRSGERRGGEEGMTRGSAGH